ncbi:hypothetical protein F0L17_20590 [Streptomyces sp. TRM43335]|uniref:Uncharacterized protein n=1 Tax=Streptomyces taklimakanensis TaxID=2569853 RepID=A0A6G2BH66_9ACTN|nr:hypothetical protein [Streptomyces taklimakanensis]MTE21466.1 hypothetical protein [Streptomyces taklimakanensis]
MAVTFSPEPYGAEVTVWPDVWIGAVANSTGAPPPYTRKTEAGRRGIGRRRSADGGGAGAEEALLRAARAARQQSGVPEGELDLVIHAPAGDAGGSDGTAAAVVRGLGCPRATAWEVRRPAGGPLVALHLAAQYVSGRAPTSLTALVTTADRGPALSVRPSARRATGLVLTASAGVARVLATALLGGGPPHGSLLRSDLAWRVPKRRTPRRRRGGDRPDAAVAVGLGERQREVARQALVACGRATDDAVRFLPPPTESEPSRDEQLGALARRLEQTRPRHRETLVLVGGDADGVVCAVLELPSVVGWSL